MTINTNRGLALIGSAIAVPLLIAANAVRRPKGAKHIGGDWHVVAIATELDPGGTMYHLHRKRGLRYTYAAVEISGYRFYEPDCVVYAGFPMIHRPMFAVCGDRAPVRIMDNGEAWTFEPGGLAKGNAMKPIDAIIALALQQPPYHKDWSWQQPRLDGVDQIESVVK